MADRLVAADGSAWQRQKAVTPSCHLARRAVTPGYDGLVLHADPARIAVFNSSASGPEGREGWDNQRMTDLPALVLSIALVVVSIFTAAFARQQGRVARDELAQEAEHLRRERTWRERRETMAAYHDWASATQAVRARLYEQLGRDVDFEHRMRLFDDDGLQLQARKVLNGLEQLALGVNLGLYDRRVLWLLGQNVIGNARERLLEPLSAVRKPDTKAGFRNLRRLVASFDDVPMESDADYWSLLEDLRKDPA
jgi:hypothetical protein